MRLVPKWFRRELKLLDPTYWIGYDTHSDSFHIMKDIGYNLVVDGVRTHFSETQIRASFKHLDRVAMTSLKRRKYLGNKFNAKGDEMAYWKDIERKDAEQKAKTSNDAIDQITEGVMKAHKLSTVKTFS